MARPKKEGLDYFSHDTDAVNDEKIETMRALYGNDGYAFYFILLERIYRTTNQELIVSDAETMQVMSKKVEVPYQRFNEMLNTALKIGLFDKELYDNNKILTSKGIKNRANMVIRRRENARSVYDTKSTYGVSNAETMQETTQITTQEMVQEIPQETHAESTQTKLNKTKVNRISIYPASEPPDEEDDHKNINAFRSRNDSEWFEPLWQLYPRKIGKGYITSAKIREMKKHGFDQMKRTVERYIEETKDRESKFLMHGSRFFGRGYIDYLDDNWKEPVKNDSKNQYQFDEIKFIDD